MENQFSWPKSGTVVLYDTEFTSWPGARECNWQKPGMHRELVQISAVRLDAGEAFAVLEMFDILIQPTINPVLSEYFIDLTGITNKDISEHGVTCIQGLRDFRDFIGVDTALSHGPDRSVLQENCDIHSFPWPFDHVKFVNLHKPVRKALGLTKSPMAFEIPKLTGIDFDAQAHNALNDVLGMAAAFTHLRGLNKI